MWLGLLTRTGVRVQDVANGAKLHVLSGKRRERGQCLPVLSEGETRGEEVPEGEILPRFIRDTTIRDRDVRSRAEATYEPTRSISPPIVRSSQQRSLPRQSRVSRGHVVFESRLTPSQSASRTRTRNADRERGRPIWNEGGASPLIIIFFPSFFEGRGSSFLEIVCQIAKRDRSTRLEREMSNAVLYCLHVVCSPDDYQGAAGVHVQTVHQCRGIRDNPPRDRGICRRGSLCNVRAFQKILWFAIDRYISSGLNVVLRPSRLLPISSDTRCFKELVRKSSYVLMFFFFKYIKTRSTLRQISICNICWRNRTRKNIVKYFFILEKNCKSISYLSLYFIISKIY